MKYAHIVRWFCSELWAILPAKLAAMSEALSYLASGGEYTPEEIEAITGRRAAANVKGTIAVLPLFGVVSHRAGMMTEASGGTSTERFAQAFRQYVSDPGIGAVVIDVDSPGGSVSGVDELASEIFRARESKPVVAIANSTMASAAYWVGSAASELVAIPSGEVGSIGVIAAHQDVSVAMEREGVTTTIMSAGKYKAEGNPYEPLSEEARAAFQERIDDYYGMFVRAVARNRGVAPAEVRDGYGQGRMVGAKRALEMGMVDRIETMDAVLARLAGNRATRRNPAASLAMAERRLRTTGRTIFGYPVVYDDSLSTADIQLGRSLIE